MRKMLAHYFLNEEDNLICTRHWIDTFMKSHSNSADTHITKKICAASSK